MNKMQFPAQKTFETTLAGRPLVIETGKMAGLSNGSCTVRFGDTLVLTNVTMSEKPRDGIDFFPLSVDFEERLYAVGRVPGSFMRREGRPSEKAILASRMIDRPTRPLFPKDMRNDVSVNNLVLSVDGDNQPEIAAMIGSSIALTISDIPFNGPIAGVNVGLVDGKLVVCPNGAERAKSDMVLTVAASKEKVVMIEAGANQVPDDIMYDGIMLAHEECKKLCDFISSIAAEIGKEKRSYPAINVDETLYEKIKAFCIEDVRAAMDTDDKSVRDEALRAVYEKVAAQFPEEAESDKKAMDEILYKIQKYVVRRWLLDDGKRVDSRSMTEVRPLAAEVGLVPRTHGSGMFSRGQTQVLTIATLGTIGDVQTLDDIHDEDKKRYIHHYNFPSWSVGETKPSRGPGRREIGHGALAEKALEPVIPSEADFPYCIRLVSEVLSSNGSTSQGSICGSTLALMDAGVPIKAPIAGISCGLVTEGDRWITFTDIQGIEDFFGDMDFKVAGSHEGITAIQMDLKTDGLTPEIIRSALDLTKTARIDILDEIMLPCISTPREELSPYAPKMIHILIDPDKIREVIGKGGSVIQKIQADHGVKIDIEDDGNLYISGIDTAGCEAALKVVHSIVKNPEPGDIFVGKVVRILPNVGAFVEVAPGKDGLVHISKLAKTRVEKVEDVVNVGDMVKVKVTEIDDKGRINLSRRDCLE